MSKNSKIDYRFVFESIAFILVLYGISSFVYLNGDDFMYGTFAHAGILSNVIDYYFTGNGRFWVNVLDSALLWFDRFGFILVLPWIVFSFLVLFAKNVQRIMEGHSDASKEKGLVRMGMVLFCCLDILCLRETVFWITGMMNYLLPAVMFLWAYLMFQKSRAGELSGSSLVGYFLLCLLTASCVEQYALMFVGMMTLHYCWDLLQKRQILKRDWLAYGLSLLGLAALILAPGNYERTAEQNAVLPPLIDNAWTLVYQDILSPAALPYVIMLSLALQLNSQANKWHMLRWIVLAVLLVGTSVASVVDKAIFSVALIAMLGALLASQLYGNKKVVTPTICFLTFVGIGSQAMLLISAIWGYRCMLSLYLVYMLIIGCFLYRAESKQRNFVLATGVLVSFHPIAAMIFWRGPFCFATGTMRRANCR